EIDGKQEIDLGYILARKFWGQGYATEAARAWLEHGLGEFKLSRICVIMDLENHASKRVAERLSVRLERTFKFSRNRGREAYLFAAER
ncbi:MAG: GNAT family N-acetyltransferase, partial [Bdellovibrionota bacterium]